ncbi:MAG TPA: DUF1772 domain-containing protein [Thermoanaerobaculia bacterium]
MNLTSSGILAGSLGFGEAALVPGWEQELGRNEKLLSQETKYFNAIGPVALASAVTLAVASRGNGAGRRALDAATAIGLAGVLASTIMVTVPINRELETQPARDYPSERSQSLTRNWSLAHAVRTTLGLGAFLCAVASNVSRRGHAK